jgi:hypothetical protein
MYCKVFYTESSYVPRPRIHINIRQKHQVIFDNTMPQYMSFESNDAIEGVWRLTDACISI